MVDIHITYEALFDILRKERSLEDIQELDELFWSHVVSYLQERSSFLEQTSLAEQEKTKLQLTNIKRILKELYEHRERKIVALARTVVRMGAQEAADDRAMLPEEKLFFKDCLALFSNYRQAVLHNVCTAQLPDFSKVSSPVKQSVSSFSDSQKDDTFSPSPSSEPASFALPTSSSSISSNTSSQALSSENNSKKTDDHFTSKTPLQESASAAQEPQKEQHDIEENEILVKFIIDVPKFAGRNKKLFGPFKEGTITSLPEQIAKILLKKQKVEFVLSP
ncbi:MAG: hypothetical protein ACOCQQ_00400 [Candidatus Nanoarchaeia archaeon]